MIIVTPPKIFGMGLTAPELAMGPSLHTSVRSPVIVQTTRRTRDGRADYWFRWPRPRCAWSPVERDAEHFGKPATTAGGCRPYFVATSLAERST